MLDFITIISGKITYKLASIAGGGSALPGLVVEKLGIDAMVKNLEDLPYGVIVVSGTNGKTSTTKFLTEMLEGQGLKVFTNKSGSNFVRGVASSWVKSCNLNGKLEADIAVLELDEAHAVHFVNLVKINYALLLNVMRDQLDRFGELDQVAELLQKIAEAAQKKIIINGLDSYLDPIIKKNNTFIYGASAEIEDRLINIDNKKRGANTNFDISLISSDNGQLNFKIGENEYSTKTAVRGLYNHYNITAAIAASSQILGEKLDNTKLLKTISALKPAFGRAETITIEGQEIVLYLVKNPSGFQSSLSDNFDQAAILIAINDQYADGRDVSWLWDIDFSQLTSADYLMTSGDRCHDMALRLKYDNIQCQKSSTDFKALIADLIQLDNQKKIIFSTYTAMLEIRKELMRLANDHNSSPLS